MVLKFEQELSSKDAMVIREIYSKRLFFSNLKDYRLFYKDFRSFLKTSTQMSYHYFLDNLVLKKLGSFAFPKNSLENDAMLANYFQEEKPYTIDNLKLGFGENYLSNGFSFFLQEPKDNDSVFSLGQFYSDWMDEELEYEKDEESENLLANGLILDFASYFHDLYPLYQKIHKTLGSNRKSLTRYLGENLLNDFLLLFSLKPQILEVPALDFSKLPLKKTFFNKASLDPEKAWLKLGNCERLYYKNKAGKSEKVLANIELWLGSSNELIILITKGKLQSSDEVAVDLKSEVFNAFVKEELGDWLKQILTSTFFADRIYQKFKTRLVLDNI